MPRGKAIADDEKLKERFKESIEEAKAEGKSEQDIEAIKIIPKAMGEEIERSESTTEEARSSWKEQEAKIKKELEVVQSTAIHITITKPDKTQGVLGTPLKTKDQMVLQEARWEQLTSSTAEELVTLHGLPQSACAVI